MFGVSWARRVIILQNVYKLEREEGRKEVRDKDERQNGRVEGGMEERNHQDIRTSWKNGDIVERDSMKKLKAAGTERQECDMEIRNVWW